MGIQTLELTPVKYLITNVVYGDLYLKIFCEQHLRSILDETNLPAIKDRVKITYRVYTDEQTKPKLLAHPNFKRLASIVDVKLTFFEWMKDDNRYNLRYSVLMNAFHDAVRFCHDQNVELLTAWVADLVVARHFFPKIIDRIDQGHDAVFVLPLRSAFEPVAALLDQENRALDAHRLFAIGYLNLHPLWVACEWRNNRFTKLPFTLLWSKASGILVRSFSVTPIIFKPRLEMLEGRGMIDGDIPAKCENPYWAEEWTDAPVMGVEPLFCYYPPFMPERAPIFRTRLWSKRSLDSTQRPYLRRPLFYPDKRTARIGWWTKFKSGVIAWLISW
jgi:hypothetical protein